MNGGEQTYVELRSRTDGRWLVHPDLRATMVADAAARGTSLSDLAVQILAERFAIRHEPSLRRSAPAPDKQSISFTMPPRLGARVRREFRKKQDGIRRVWSEHYGLPLPEPVVRTRKRRSAEPAAA